MKNVFSSLLKSIIRFFRRQFRNPRKRIMIEAVSAAVIVGIVIFMVFSNRSLPTNDLKEGVSYIKSLEEKDTAPVEKEIKEIKKAERKKALESGEIDVWQQFDDAVILGDSRAVGFFYHEFIDSSRVLATGGATIRDISKYTDQIKTLNPSSIILCFGLNDISIGYWDNVDDYIKELDEMLKLLNDTLKDTRVFVNSTIPAIDPAFERSQKWKNIPDWNAAIKEHCEEESIPYIDVTDTMEEHSNLYDPDGIHVKKEFYEFWAIDMITEINEYE